MTPRERLLAALGGEMPDRIPFVMWSNKMPGGEMDRRLLDLEACVVNKSSVYRTVFKVVRKTVVEERQGDGMQAVRTTYRTPAGTISEVTLPQFDAWRMEYLFTSEKDYDALEALLSDRSREADYEQFKKDDRAYGEQTLGRPATILTPLQEVLYRFMGLETFGLEWNDNRERILRLVALLADDYRRRVELVAESPAHYAVVDGNIDVHALGPERIRKYCFPYIDEAVEILHAKNKLVCAHLDADNRLLVSLVAKSSLDFIESFTPPPDCDLSLSEAREAWPEKALLINFPASVHLGGSESVEHAARRLLREAAPGNGVAIGVLENRPEKESETIIALGSILHEEGMTPLRVHEGTVN